MKRLLSILLVFFIIIVCGCMEESSSRGEICIIFNDGVTITEANELIESYNLSAYSIKNESIRIENENKMLIVAYIICEDSMDCEEISIALNNESIVWRCSIEKPEG